MLIAQKSILLAILVIVILYILSKNIRFFISQKFNEEAFLISLGVLSIIITLINPVYWIIYQAVHLLGVLAIVLVIHRVFKRKTIKLHLMILILIYILISMMYIFTPS